jgi:hypothetical protein
LDTITLGEKIRTHLVHLLPVFGLELCAQRVLRVYDLITRESLVLDLDAPIPRFSTINADGVPFELSVSLGAREGGLRFLTEVGVPGSSIAERINLSCIRLGEVLRELQLEKAGAEVNQAFQVVFPRDPMDLRGWRGGMWLAVRFLRDGRAGLRIYIDATHGTERERWQRAATLLAQLGRTKALESLCRLSPIVSATATPLGIALDILPSGVGGIKFYTRTFDPGLPRVDRVLEGVDLLPYRDELHRFLEILSAESPGLPPSALVLSLEFPREEDAPLGLKIDACAHCLFPSDRAAHLRCQALGQRLEVDLHQYEATLDELSGGSLSEVGVNHHAFFGIGFSQRESRRLNIYLKPSVAAYPLHPRPSRSPRRSPDLKGAVAEAVKYLVAHQSPAGQWLDFHLPTGPSDAWVTAYVGLALARLPVAFRSPADLAVQRAGAWCATVIAPDGGWGYNAFTGSDADSTAHAILFRLACGQPVPAASYDLLRGFQREDGGFATYCLEDPNDSWGHSHPDVTPVALEALLSHLPQGHRALRAGRRYVIAGQGGEGVWQSFWWDSSLYGTWANIRLLMKTRWRFDRQRCLDSILRQGPPQDAFGLALYAGCLSMLSTSRAESSPRLEESVAELLRAQSADGSWPARPMLRLSDRTCATPWAKASAGELFADGRSLFTTATVLHCLQPILPAGAPDHAFDLGLS